MDAAPSTGTGSTWTMLWLEIKWCAGFIEPGYIEHVQMELNSLTFKAGIRNFTGFRPEVIGPSAGSSNYVLKPGYKIGQLFGFLWFA
jgi:hypothetical protein